VEAAAAWLRDLLAPAAVRNEDADQISLAAAQQEVAQKYLEHSNYTVLYVTSDGEDDNDQQQQQEDEATPEAAAAVEGGDVPLSDVAAAALQPPLPLDAFVDPHTWWQRQQELFSLDRACDHCGIEAAISQVRCGLSLSTDRLVCYIGVLEWGLKASDHRITRS
jgi:hypothetical protein